MGGILRAEVEDLLESRFQTGELVVGREGEEVDGVRRRRPVWSERHIGATAQAVNVDQPATGQKAHQIETLGQERCQSAFRGQAGSKPGQVFSCPVADNQKRLRRITYHSLPHLLP